MADSKVDLLYGLPRPGQNGAMFRSLEGIEVGAFGFLVLATSAGWGSLILTPELALVATDLKIILGLTLGCSLAALLSPTLKPFLVAHSLRTLLLLMAAATVGGHDGTILFFLLVPFLLETTLYLGTRTALTWGLLATLLVLTLSHLSWVEAPPSRWLPGLALLGLASGGSLTAGLLLTHYRNQVVKERVIVDRLNRDVDQLIQANRAFQDYADTIESVTEENERNRITRELHDVIGYSLTNVIMMMNAGKVLSRDHPEKLGELFLQARAHADEALQESRKILYTLRAIQPAARKGLSAIHHLAQSFQAATDIQVDVAYGNLPQTLGADIDSALFRLVQEGMTNALRHGQAKQVKIRFWRFDHEVQVQVWDNGKGAQAVTEGLGLSGMRERFSALGGQVAAGPVTDGFQVTATIPLAQEWTLEP